MSKFVDNPGNDWLYFKIAVSGSIVWRNKMIADSVLNKARCICEFKENTEITTALFILPFGKVFNHNPYNKTEIFKNIELKILNIWNINYVEGKLTSEHR